ncbi:hypothetical protein SAMN02745196_00782 [Clostridium collagenovorans DSM 3089]|uniref:Glucose / Sorbosone dehydrogenase n=1 Tax=Clostridium collagenovorans DSM 3089 TaxID=1121306 RepID=A0A1M5TZ63_9CLOT|nr:hypothetical protein [Clostridium collagenovorans]SHH56115.1 hypothetical protein SAMN02745196_00782 [Clostridium collagenovorans DSM 3089]
MKKGICLGVIIVCLSALIYVYNPMDNKEKYNLVDKEHLSSGVVHKGIKGVVDFVYDEEENLYIAYKDKIQFINKKGYSKNIFKNKKMDIKSLEYSNGKLYFSSFCSIYEYDLVKNINKEIVKNLPNKGDYNESLLKIKDNYMYISVGAATNSGVVGEDNKWLKDYPENCDISPNDISLKGDVFNNTGAFVAYDKKNEKGEIIKGVTPGNSSVLIYNLETNAMETYAWGIRNIKGMDFNSEEKLIASVGGIEDRGARPLKNDVDYIYSLKKNVWYGFPDYSGGDPVNSPRFQDDNSKTQEFILDKHPNYNPPSPIYQHDSIDSLSCLAIDKNGYVGEKDDIYFYDYKGKTLLKCNKENIITEELNVSEGEITKIKIFKDNIYILDKKSGIIYKIGKK